MLLQSNAYSSPSSPLEGEKRGLGGDEGVRPTHKRYGVTWLLLLLAFLLTLPHPSQAQRRPKRARPATTQGIRGTVFYLQGNFMPSPDGASGGSRKPVARKLLLFAPPLDADIMESGALDGPFVDLGKRVPAYTVRSGRDGRFRLRLEPGTYSLIVQEPDGRYKIE